MLKALSNPGSALIYEGNDSMIFKIKRDAMGDLLNFMKSVRGSIYNAGFISCKDCPKSDCQTRDFAFAPDSFGKPILIKRFDIISLANDLEPELYKFIAKSQDFIEFYSESIMWNTQSNDECPLLKLSLQIDRESVSNSDNKFLKIGKAKEEKESK